MIAQMTIVTSSVAFSTESQNRSSLIFSMSDSPLNRPSGFLFVPSSPCGNSIKGAGRLFLQARPFLLAN
jgi:hypothetical protein